MRSLLLVPIVLLIACSPSPKETKKTAIAEPMPVAEKPPVVVNQRAIRGLLADAEAPPPGKAALDMHGDADVELRRLAVQDTDLAVRVRAVRALRHYPDPATRRLLASMRKAEKLHPELRAAVEATLKVLPPA